MRSRSRILNSKESEFAPHVVGFEVVLFEKPSDVPADGLRDRSEQLSLLPLVF